MAAATMVMNDMHRLFDGGALAGRPDAQLLERFVTGGDESSFAALVSRHGPMVLATCRAVLRDAEAAEDAFQATFLVLARKAGSVRGRDALGGWLHRVAYRAAVQANRAAERRRLEERKAAEMRASAAVREEVRDDSSGPLIHAECSRAAPRGAAPAPGRALRPGRDEPRAGRRRTPMDRGDRPRPSGARPGEAQGAADPAWCGPDDRGDRGDDGPRGDRSRARGVGRRDRPGRVGRLCGQRRRGAATVSIVMRAAS